MMEFISETPSTKLQDSESPPDDADDKGLITYVQRVKLAVAVAVIKSTPKGMQPKDYATSLVKSFTSDISSWKTKCHKLEEEVFALEQKLETVKLKTHVSLACPGLDAYEPLCANLPETQTANTVTEVNIKDTLEFVRSFILLDSLCTSGNHISNDTDEFPTKHNNMISKSVLNLLGFLKSDDGLKMEFSIVKRAMTEIHRLFDIPFGKLNNELVDICLSFVDGLLFDIHKTLEINKIEEQHKRSSLLQMLAEHRSLTPLILCRLLREITVTSDFLEAIFREDNENFLHLLHAENTYYVLQATEGVLKIMRQENSSLSALKIPDNLLSEWDKMATKSLSELGTHFPMYCVYVWHLKTLMASVFSVPCEEF